MTDVECGVVNPDTGKACELQAGHPIPFGRVQGKLVYHAHDNPNHVLTWWAERTPMEPTEKAQSINDFIKQVMGKDREETIRSGKCMTCEEPDAVATLKDELSRREYTISGMCQACQDSVFGGGD